MLGFWDGYESDASAEEAVVLADAVVDQQAASEVYADRSARVQFLLAEQRARKMLVQHSNALLQGGCATASSPEAAREDWRKGQRVGQQVSAAALTARHLQHRTA